MADSLRIERGDYFADLLQIGDGSKSEPVWFYTIQHKPTDAIIEVKNFPTHQEAVNAAQDKLSRLVRAAPTD